MKPFFTACTFSLNRMLLQIRQRLFRGQYRKRRRKTRPAFHPALRSDEASIGGLLVGHVIDQFHPPIVNGAFGVGHLRIAIRAEARARV